MTCRHLILKDFILRFLLLMTGAASALMALDPAKSITQYSLHIWNMEGGLPGNCIYAVQQTGDGYLWLGTGDGLVRFDGLNFELYKKEKNPELQNSPVRALYVDNDDTLWIGMDYSGLTRYKDGEFITYPTTKYPPLHKIRAINKDRWGNLWIGSFTGGLSRFKNDEFTTFSTKEGLPHKKVHSIYKDGNGDLWVGTSGGIVKIVEPGNFSIITNQKSLPHLHTACLYRYDKEELWIGTGDGGVFRLKNGVFTAYGVKEGLPHPTVNSLFEDSMKNLWIGTDGGGLTRFTNGEFNTLAGGTDLADGFVYPVFEDREGSLWVGTLDGGLHQLRDSKFSTYTSREGLIDDYINYIRESSTGGLWIGTKKGLNLRQKEGMTIVLPAGKGLPAESVLCVSEAPGGTLWIGTNKGLHSFNNGKLKTFKMKDGLSDNSVNCIFVDSKGDTWIGTGNGLNRYTENSGGKQTFAVITSKGRRIADNITFIMEDGGGRLWIGTDRDLYYLKEGDIHIFIPPPGIEYNAYRCVYEDKEGVLWVGTDGGLLRLPASRAETEAILYTTGCGLIENHVYSILGDENKYLWLGGRNGISRIRKKELEEVSTGKIKGIQPDSYNEYDGMKSRWCTSAACKTGDGKFWFPTSVGIVMVDPGHMETGTPAPSLIIEKLIADGESIYIHETAKQKKYIELSPGKRRLQFFYTAVSFINSKKMKFQIRLKGYDSNWIDMGTARTTTYTGLPPGIYNFEVTGCNADGLWNRDGASFSFYLKPYFTQTVWFYLVMVLVVSVSAFSLYRFRVRQLRARERELSHLVDSRTRDLIERNIELGKAHKKLTQSKEIIEEKNRHIMDSMRYARKIQQAMLPMGERMENELEEHFVIYRPKDIVSGDFYWFDVVDDHYFLAVADCTGHGVPGALLSMIGYMMLNEAVKGLNIYDPAMILDYLHQGFRSVLKQEMEEIETNDGMSVGLVRMDMKEGKVVFAGAGRPLYYVKNSELFEIKGNRKSIGGHQREDRRTFTNHEIDGPVFLYLTTDGFTDQHNVEDKKYGSRHLKKFLRSNEHLNAILQKEALLNELRDHQSGVEQRDDITIIGIRIP